MKNLNNCPFDVMMIFSKNLEVPRSAYQRELDPIRVRKIAAEFDERIANDPKVSFRDGHYYVFDGQHTIAARKLRNGGEDLPIRCKVFYGLSELDEAILFAQQTGASAQLTAGARLRALVYGRDPDALAEGVFSFIKSGAQDAAIGALVSSLAEETIRNSISLMSDDPDKFLSNLGIEGGVSGLDFSDSHWEPEGENGKAKIEIVVKYSMKNVLFPDFDFGQDYEFCQSASTLTW